MKFPKVKAGGLLIKGAGAVAGLKLGQAVSGRLSGQNKIVRVAVVGGLGVLLANMKQPIAQGAGIGMIAAAGSEALAGTGIGMAMFNQPVSAVLGPQNPGFAAENVI